MRQRVQCGVHHDPPRGLLADQHSRLEVNEGHEKKTHDFLFDSLQVLAYYRLAGRWVRQTHVGLPRITLRVSAVLKDHSVRLKRLPVSCLGSCVSSTWK
jgi:hypothetical protein